MSKSKEEAEVIYNLFFNICGYLNHLNEDGGDVYRLDYNNHIAFNQPLPPVLAKKRQITQELMNCFLNHDIKLENCKQGIFTRWLELNRTLISQYDLTSGRALRYTKEQFDQTNQHIDEEQQAEISDAAQLSQSLKAALRGDLKPLIDALQLICSDENIKLLETRRNPAPDSNSWLDQILSAIYNFINTVSFNYIAPVQGKEITKSLFRLFDMTDEYYRNKPSNVHDCMTIEITEEEMRNAQPCEFIAHW